MRGDAVTMLTMTRRELDTVLSVYGVIFGSYGFILALYYPRRLRRNREEVERGRPVIQRLAGRLDARYEPAHQSDRSLMFDVPRFGVVTGQQDRLTFTFNPSSQSGEKGGHLFLTVEPVPPLHFEIGPKELFLEPLNREFDDLAQVLGARSARRYDPTTAALLLALARNSYSPASERWPGFTRPWPPAADCCETRPLTDRAGLPDPTSQRTPGLGLPPAASHSPTGC